MKRIFLFSIFAGSLLLLSCSKPENYIDGKRLIVTDYVYFLLNYNDRLNTNTITKELNFTLGDRRITLRSENGVWGRSPQQGLAGEPIEKGSRLPFYLMGVSKEGPDGRMLENPNLGIPASKARFCTLQVGDGRYCEFFDKGPCLFHCHGQIDILILNETVLERCLGVGEGEGCTFHNGEVLELLPTTVPLIDLSE
jgi:hypothetical protein